MKLKKRGLQKREDASHRGRRITGDPQHQAGADARLPQRPRGSKATRSCRAPTPAVASSRVGFRAATAQNTDQVLRGAWRHVYFPTIPSPTGDQPTFHQVPGVKRRRPLLRAKSQPKNSSDAKSAARAARCIELPPPGPASGSAQSPPRGLQAPPPPGPAPPVGPAARAREPRQDAGGVSCAGRVPPPLATPLAPTPPMACCAGAGR